MKRPIRKSSLYTRAGDRGQTSLFGGQRVAKAHPRVEAYGSVDELNSALGVAVSFLRQPARPGRRLVRLLQSIQNELFDIGAELASEQPVKGAAGQPFHVGPDRIEALERLIDEYDAKVPPLKTFILPSGPPAAAHLHHARSVCRRAERAVVRLASAEGGSASGGESEAVNPHILAYLNRLSDLLFALARYVNKAERRKELPWRKDWR